MNGSTLACLVLVLVAATLGCSRPSPRPGEAAPASSAPAVSAPALSAPAPSRDAPVVTMDEIESDFAIVFPSAAHLREKRVREVVASTSSGVGSVTRQETRRYDDAGRCVFEQVREGAKQLYTRETKALPDGRWRTFTKDDVWNTEHETLSTHDAAGRTTSRTTEHGVERATYELRGAVVAKTTYEGKEGVFRVDVHERDGSGREIRRVVRRGEAVVELRPAYDGAGNLARVSVIEGERPILDRIFVIEGGRLVEERVASHVPAVASERTTFTYRSEAP